MHDEQASPAHDPEKLVLDVIEGWVPVFGKDHAQSKVGGA
jgi:hypothetical protein